VCVLEIDKTNRRLSLGHKQLEENPWDVFETVFTQDSVHEGTIVEMLDKGAVIQLEYGVEGFATPKHLVKEDGTQAQKGEKLQFKVIEFNKDSKRIILSHSRIFEDVQRAEAREAREAKKATRKAAPKEEAPLVQNQAASTTLGDLDALAELKAKMKAEEKPKAKKAAKEEPKAEPVEEPKAEPVAEEPKAEAEPVAEAPAEEPKAEE
ncbi:MAG: S1 RNA-binding domain-containing protein, partial [Bacteroidaceae bacterium]|nr:S1 RNA-binding domain-containing protein [Bacteroidaceae bacterium]